MKNYTAIYSTKTISNINYSFKAENLEKAFDFCKCKFDIKNLIGGFEIVED